MRSGAGYLPSGVFLSSSMPTATPL